MSFVALVGKIICQQMFVRRSKIRRASAFYKKTAGNFFLVQKKNAFLAI